MCVIFYFLAFWIFFSFLSLYLETFIISEARMANGSVHFPADDKSSLLVANIAISCSHSEPIPACSLTSDIPEKYNDTIISRASKRTTNPAMRTLRQNLRLLLISNSFIFYFSPVARSFFYQRGCVDAGEGPLLPHRRRC